MFHRAVMRIICRMFMRVITSKILSVVLKVWSSYQQHWHHLGTCKKSKFLEPTPDLQKFRMTQQSVLRGLEILMHASIL